MTATITITNPILSGMNPDPSWIWDDEFQRIVLVTSTFELVPGLPIYVSEDMTCWKHVSNVVDADLARRLLIPFVDDSGGVYAPTLRRIHGKYVIACTIARLDDRRAMEGGCTESELMRFHAAEGNFILEADSIEGPWHGPFWIEGAEGIDPDIFEDGDGNVYWTQTRPAVNPQWEGQTEVWTQRINPETWTFVDDGLPAGSGKTVIWRGYGMESVWAEAPHLYRVGDYVYLMTAEGAPVSNIAKWPCASMRRMDCFGRSKLTNGKHPNWVSAFRRFVTGNAAILAPQSVPSTRIRRIRFSPTDIWVCRNRCNAWDMRTCCFIRNWDGGWCVLA